MCYVVVHNHKYNNIFVDLSDGQFSQSQGISGKTIITQNTRGFLQTAAETMSDKQRHKREFKSEL